MKKIDLSQYKSHLKSRIRKGITNKRKLFQEIKSLGYMGCYLTLVRFIRKEFQEYSFESDKKNKQFGKKALSSSRKYKPAIRFETEPGQQSQVDWAHFGMIIVNSKKEKLYCFVYVLGYSRMLYIEFTTKQNLIVFESCHINAFKALGIPKEIVYDNTKTVIIHNRKLQDGSREIVYNSQFLDFAKYYEFHITASPPYWPRNKGKVERSIKYIKGQLLQDIKQQKNLDSLESLNIFASEWVSKIANERLHATTNDRPVNRWVHEKKILRFPNPLSDYKVSSLQERFATKDQFLSYKQNFYSVPPESAQKKLYIKEVHEHGLAFVKIYYKGLFLTQHYLDPGRNHYVENPNHFQKSSQQIKEDDRKVKKDSKWKNIGEIPSRPLEYYSHLISKASYGKIKS